MSLRREGWVDLIMVAAVIAIAWVFLAAAWMVRGVLRFVHWLR